MSIYPDPNNVEFVNMPVVLSGDALLAQARERNRAAWLAAEAAALALVAPQQRQEADEEEKTDEGT